MRKEKHDSGFTLAELLIVVAIIGVLVAISIPIFSSQLEKAREATDTANIRSQYAEVMTDAILSDGSVNSNHAAYEPIPLKQQKDEWQSTGLKANLEGVFGNVVGDYPKAGGHAWVEYDASTDTSILHYEDGSGSSGGSGSGSGGGKTEPPQPETEESTDDNTIPSFSYKEWPTTTDFSDNKTVTTTLTTGELFTYKGKHYVSLQDKIYTESQWYQDNPDNPNNANTLVCIDNSKIVTERDGRYREDWNKYQIYMNYGDIYKTRKGEYYFYKGDSCDQDCPEENAVPGQWVKLLQ